MRFAGNTSNVGSWIQAGKAGAKGAADAFKVARSSAPDYGGLAEANMKSRSDERVAATQAEAYVAQAGIEAKKDVKLTNIKVDAESKILDMKIDAKRKAGMVGMFGAVALGGVNAVENNRAAKRQAERDAKSDASEAAYYKYLEGRLENAPEAPDEEPFKPGTAPDTKPYVAKPYQSPGGTSDSSTDTDTSIAPTDYKPGQVLSKPEIKALAIKAGFPEDIAPTITQIAMGESSGKVDAHNPDASTGDNSYGLMQINMLGDMGPERRSSFGLKSNEELFNPLKNMQAAYKIYQTQGLEAWGAYTNGSYAKH